MRVVCVDNREGRLNLVIGQIYNVLHYSNVIQVDIADKKNHSGAFFKERFRDLNGKDLP